MTHYFFQDPERKKIREELLTTKAEEWAKTFINPKRPKERHEKNPDLTSAQLRRFHTEAKTLEDRCTKQNNPDMKFDQVRPLFKMLKSKVAYACPINGKERKVPEEFRNYLEEMIDNVNDWTDFKAFALCFEAVVGYFYGQGGRKQ